MQCIYLTSKTTISFIFFCFTSQLLWAQESRFRVSNQCQKPIWVQQDYKSTTDDPIVVKVLPGEFYDYHIPDKGLPATRFWPKMDCNDHGYQCAMMWMKV